eukprot:4798050-Pleurochrysis_carterae.AAC.2
MSKAVHESGVARFGQWETKGAASRPTAPVDYACIIAPLETSSPQGSTTKLHSHVHVTGIGSTIRPLERLHSS